MNQKPVKDLEAWFWFYKENVKNYSGLNFTARNSACDVLTECLANWNPELQRKRAFNLPELDPKDEAKVSGGQKFRCFRKLRLIWSDEPVGISIFQDREERLLELTFDAASVATLLRIIAEVKAGRGDMSIGIMTRRTTDSAPEESSLWYWPCFGHLYPLP